MYRIAIVEDETEYAEMFASYIARFAEEHGEKITVDRFSDGLEISEEYAPNWDAVLLDIRMKYQDGMSAARVIRAHDPDVALMFITTLAQYAIYGYEVGAVDYVLKPVEYEKFAIRFERLLRSIKRSPEEYLMLPSGDVKDRVEISKIRYISVDHHDLTVSVDDRGKEKRYTVRKSISAMEKALEGKGFVRCDQSAMVNLSYVTKIGKDVLEIDGTPIPVSRARRKSVMDAIAQANL